MAYLPPPTSFTVNRIYAKYEASQQSWESASIGFSALGGECDREIWYLYRRAVSRPPTEGRMLRLFQTGNREEKRMIDDLIDAGCTVTDQQTKCSLCRGHLRGKPEGIVTGLQEAPKTPHVLECKSHNDKSFKAVVSKGVREAKYEHWVQTMLGIHALKLTRGAYLAVNKNTDELHLERIEYDPVVGMRLEARADRIIDAHQPPPKLHEDPNGKMAWKCGYCPARAVCHEGAMPRRECRTCLHSTPVQDGWHCDKHDITFGLNNQAAKCASHRFLPAIVPGEQIDADPKAETVTYRLRDGSTWIDGVAA